MYQWDKQRTSLNTAAGKVLRLERSIADVQVSLPGLAPEQACAYLCAYQEGEGIRIAVVLHLLKSDQVAFYMNPGGPLDSEAAGRELGEGLRFAESLGFTLGELDFRRLAPDAQSELWSSLNFFLAPDISQQKRQPKYSSRPSEPPPAARQRDAASEIARPVVVQVPSAPPKVEAKLPSAEEMLRHRKAFIRNLGRLLGML
jgi:hypothetical protein